MIRKIFNNFKIKSILSAFISLFIIAIFIWVDQYTKYLCETNTILKSGTPICFIEGVMDFDLCYNTGIALGLFKNSQMFFAVISFIFGIIFLAYVIFTSSYKNDTLKTIAFVLITGGTFGNGIDRAFNYEGVVDFIQFTFWPLQNFATFNLADAFISIGGALLVVYVLFIYKEGELNA